VLWVKKVDRAESFQQFSNGQLQISDRGDFGCSKFLFWPYIPAKLEFLAPNFALMEETFPTRTEFPDRPKFRGGAIVPLCTPLSHPCHNATAHG